MVKGFLSSAWKRVKKAWPVNRVVTILTPIVFVPAAAAASAWTAVHFPGLPHFDPTVVAGYGALGASAALAAGYKWMDGWIKDKIVPKQIVENKVTQVKAPARK
jgi:hypothetical protein